VAQVGAVAKAAGSSDGMQALPRCRRPPPPNHLLPLAVGAGATRVLRLSLHTPPQQATVMGRRRDQGSAAASSAARAGSLDLSAQHSLQTCAWRCGGAGRDRTAVTGARAAHHVGRPLATAVAHIHPPAASNTRAASMRPITDATCNALSPRLSAPRTSAAVERCAHDQPPSPPPLRADTAHARQHSRCDAARPRHARTARPQTASHRLAAAATGDIPCRCVAAAWAGRRTARGTRSFVALEGVAAQARARRRWDSRA
jgi:hypothetical protein